MPGPTLPELQAKVTELNESLQAEQQQVQDLLAQKDTLIAEKDALIAQKDAAIEALNVTITNLEALVAEGGTSDERQALLDELNTIKSDLESTVAP